MFYVAIALLDYNTKSFPNKISFVSFCFLDGVWILEKGIHVKDY